MKPEIVEINGKIFIRVGDTYFDVFECSDKSVIGLTFYERGTHPIKDGFSKFVDVYIHADMSVTSI